MMTPVSSEPVWARLAAFDPPNEFLACIHGALHNYDARVTRLQVSPKLKLLRLHDDGLSSFCVCNMVRPDPSPASSRGKLSFFFNACRCCLAIFVAATLNRHGCYVLKILHQLHHGFIPGQICCSFCHLRAETISSGSGEAGNGDRYRSGCVRVPGGQPEAQPCPRCMLHLVQAELQLNFQLLLEGSVGCGTRRPRPRRSLKRRSRCQQLRLGVHRETALFVAINRLQRFNLLHCPFELRQLLHHGLRGRGGGVLHRAEVTVEVRQLYTIQLSVPSWNSRRAPRPC